MEAYYKHESDLFVIKNFMSDCLKKEEECLKEEEDHIEAVEQYYTTMRKLLITKCEHVLVHVHVFVQIVLLYKKRKAGSNGPSNCSSSSLS